MHRRKAVTVGALLAVATGAVIALVGASGWRDGLEGRPGRRDLPDPTVVETAPPWRTLPWRLEVAPGTGLVPQAAEQSGAPGSADFAVTYELVRRRGLLRWPTSTGTVTVTERRLQNGDVFLFTRLRGAGSSPVPVRLVLELEGNRFELTDFARRDQVHEHHPVSGVDPTTYPIGLLNTFHFDALRWSVMIGRQYVSRELVHRYGDGRESRLRELLAERKELDISSDGQEIRLTIPLSAPAGVLAEHWLVAAREPLFRDREVLDAWVDKSIEEYLTTNKWYTPDGTFSKLPWSIEPFTRMGYGRHLTNTQEEEALERYRSSGERYFADLVLNAVAVLHRTRDPRLGLWLTEYTSTWLKDAYHIGAPYVDTRHNEAVGRFLQEAAHTLGLRALMEADIPYADFLVEQARSGRVIRLAPAAYLLFDYYVPGRSVPTHASLNHSLAEMNYLLEVFRRTGKADYLEVAWGIRRGVEALGERWVRQNGDLWYQVNPDGTLAGSDYVLLTLYDLLEAQERWQAVGQGRSPVFDALIRAKVRYLLANGHALPADVRRQLQRQGLGDLLRPTRGTT